MSETHLHYSAKPSNGMAMVKALILPRTGFNAKHGLPNLQSHWHAANTSAIELDNFFETLDIKPTEYLPITYPHVIAGSMHMNMMTNKVFPIRLLGSLHLKNRIVQIRQIARTELIDIDANVGGFRLTNSGVEFDLVTNVKVNNELVWQETSTFLVRGKFGGKENPSSTKSFELESLSDTTVLGKWHIPESRGREYAKISGDYNPIHMSPWAAKMFGFKRDIAHGFGVVAQAIEQSKALTKISTDDAIQMDVVFKGPVFLGSDVTIHQNISQHADRYDIYCGDNERPNICLSLKKLEHE